MCYRTLHFNVWTKFKQARPKNTEHLLITKEAYWSAQLFSLSPFGLNKRQEFHSKNRIHYS